MVAIFMSLFIGLFAVSATAQFDPPKAEFDGAANSVTASNGANISVYSPGQILLDGVPIGAGGASTTDVNEVKANLGTHTNDATIHFPDPGFYVEGTDLDLQGNSVYGVAGVNFTNATGSGEVVWSDEHATLEVNNGLFTYKSGQDVLWHVVNTSGGLIEKGSVVSANGVTNDNIAISKYLADGGVPVRFVLGVAAHDIADGAMGAALAFGLLDGVDMNGFGLTDVLYPSATVAGQFTNVEPAVGEINLPMALVAATGTLGRIAVRLTPIDYNGFAWSRLVGGGSNSVDQITIDQGFTLDDEYVTQVLTNLVASDIDDFTNAVEGIALTDDSNYAKLDTLNVFTTDQIVSNENSTTAFTVYGWINSYVTNAYGEDLYIGLGRDGLYSQVTVPGQYFALFNPYNASSQAVVSAGSFTSGDLSELGSAGLAIKDGYVTKASIDIQGNVIANSYSGDGSALTDVPFTPPATNTTTLQFEQPIITTKGATFADGQIGVTNINGEEDSLYSMFINTSTNGPANKNHCIGIYMGDMASAEKVTGVSAYVKTNGTVNHVFELSKNIAGGGDMKLWDETGSLVVDINAEDGGSYLLISEDGGSGVSPNSGWDSLRIDSGNLNAGIQLTSANGGNQSIGFGTQAKGNNAAVMQYISSVDKLRWKLLNVTQLELGTTGASLLSQPTCTNVANSANEIVNYATMTGQGYLDDDSNYAKLSAANTFTNTGNSSFAGSIGIGTNAPDKRLEVVDGDGIIVRAVDARLYLMESDQADNNYRLQTAGSDFYVSEVDDNYSVINHRLRISSTGDVAIGDTDPETELHVYRETPGDPRLLLETSSADKWVIGIDDTDANNDLRFNFGTTVGGGLLTISSVGDVGIGSSVTTPTEKLEVDGNVKTTGDVIVDMTDASGSASSFTEWAIGGTQGQNDNWRIGVINSNLTIQVRVGGDWTNAAAFTRP